MPRHLTCLLLCTGLLQGCASMPDLTINYFLARAELDVTVTQTGGCTAGGLPIVSSSVAFRPNYMRGARKSFVLRSLGQGPSKADAGFEFYPDGRLKAVNASQTGQSSDVLSSLLSIAKAIPLIYDEANTKAACNALAKLVGAGKTLTVVYRGRTEFGPTGDANAIALAQTSLPDATMNTLLPIFGEVMASYDLNPDSVTSQPGVGDYDGPALALVEPAEAAVHVSILRAKDIVTEQTRVWVPQHGRDYKLPVQRAPWFGENKFSVALSESGRISKLTYSGGGTAAAALSSIADSAESVAAATTKQKVEQVKAEADLIHQQQRLVACRIDPASC